MLTNSNFCGLTLWTVDFEEFQLLVLLGYALQIIVKYDVVSDHSALWYTICYPTSI